MRLLSAIGAYGTQTFAYDADGNRLSESFTQRYGRSDNTRTGSYAYDTASNMLQSVSGLGGMQYTYTSNGNLAREANGRTDRSFTYDARNRLSSLTNQGMSAATVRYKTNALGERVQKSGASDGLNDFDDATDYIYDEQGRLIAEGHDGRISREYIYLGSLPVAELTHGQVYYVHDNHLGAPQKMTNAQQRIVWNRISEPFGKTYALKGDQDLMNLRFPGQYHDAESGLDYNMFRSYDPSTGRYTQSDPIGLSGGINTYAYTGNDPVNGVDPLGLLTLQIGYSGNLSIFGYSVLQGGGGIALDLHSNLGTYTYGGGGLAYGAETGRGWSIQFSNANTIYDLKGAFANASLNAGAGYGGSIDYFTGTTDSGQTVYGGGVTFGPSAGASATFSTTWTQVCGTAGCTPALPTQLTPASPPTKSSSQCGPNS